MPIFQLIGKAFVTVFKLSKHISVSDNQDRSLQANYFSLKFPITIQYPIKKYYDSLSLR